MGVTRACRAGYYIPSGCHAQDGLSCTQTRHGREGQDTHRYSALSPVTDHASRSGSRGEDTARNNRSMMQTAGAWCRGHEDPSAWSQGKNICSVILLWLIRNTSPAVNIGAGGLSATFPKIGKGVIKKSLGVISVNY